MVRPGSMDGGIHRIKGPGETTEVICGRFSCARVHAPRRLNLLPRLSHVEARQGRPLEWLRMISKTRNFRPGSAIMIEQLLDLLFIQAIRH